MANGSLRSSDSRSLAELLQQRADSDASSGHYIFLNPDSGKHDRSTYQELDRRAGAIARRLGEICAPGDRVLIVCPPGLDYIAAFFGCLYAQTIAVPAYSLTASRIERTLPRLAAIVNDAQAQVALTTAAVQAHMAASDVHPAGLQELTWIAVDDLPADAGYAFHPGAPEQLAFLMYTSGSTGMPKGVKVTHANALHNLRAFPGFQSRPCHTVVSWLPLFHDLGLFLGVLHPLFQAAPSILMAPTDFVRNPLIWLEALSTFGGTTTGGPNFAYDLCVRKITPEQRQTLDLRPWTMALNGAEPIRAEVLERFTQTFAAAGFRPETFYPSYGMADATATVTGSAVMAPPTVISVDRAALSAGRGVTVPATPTTTVTLVGCGGSLADQEIRIVDPERLEACPPATVGEIWVSGPSIGPGYWQRPQATQETFGARLAETGDRAYLRTGDLGFFHAGELFITGRLKDVIIVRGHNHYPEDIEQTIERSHPAIRPGCGVAFALDHAGEECLAVVQEVDPAGSGADIIAAIRRCVTEHHDIGVQIIALIQPGSLPKTSSGKLQRSRTRERLLEGSLALVARWEGWHSSLDPAPAPAAGGIVQWLTDWIAHHMGVDARSISASEPLSSFNLDSLAAVSMLGDLERQLGRTLAPTLLWSYPTIGALAAYLSGAPQAAKSPALAPDATANEPIAIIGLGCNFPGAPDLAAFWQVLSEQQDQITAIPASRWDAAAMYDPNLAIPGKVATRWGGFLSDADTFDAGLFGISPREAPHIDPQHRKLLEVAWAALEHAGEAPDGLAGSATGVFIGICNSDHARLELADDQAIGQYGGTGTAYSLAANRLSYSLDLAGPSMAIDTACSSSLVALHLACQSLRSGECDRALIGGVNLILGPEITIAFSKARMMAADGRCKAFDSRADGYVRSEGVGVLVAKRRSQAIADGDRILALVRGSAISQDGRSNGITAPNGLAQQAVIRQALRRAQISPANLAMIEAHGTGTPLGDAVEIAALDAVLGQQSSKIALGSVKTNIGHTEAAAGIAGVIKVVLAMMHDSIPAQLFGHPPSPQLNLAATALDLAVVARPWPADPDRRFAGVSSFGFGGTIAHVVLEHPSAPPPDPERADRTHHLLALSGRDERALAAQIRQMQAALADSGARFADICHTLGRGRAQLPHRLALVAETSAQAQAMLAQQSAAGQSSNLWCSAAHTFNEPIVFVFTGQGGQHLEMGCELYASNAVFRAALDECQRLLGPHLEQPLLRYLYPGPDDERVPEAMWALQPALFAFEYALAQMWMAWNVRPAAVLGHSMGEYVAACIAGVLSLEDGLKLVTYRAKCVERLPKDGAMLAVMASAEVVHGQLAPFNGAISVASYNSPSLVIVTGAKPALETLTDNLARAEISYRTLPIANAFHSPAMRPIADEFAALAREIQHHPAQIPLVANLTGSIATADQLGPDYWVQHLLEPVQFQRSIECLLQQQYRIFLEIGPRPTLANTIKRIVPADADGLILASLSSPYQPDWQMLMATLGQLFTRGVSLDWRAIDADYQRSIVALPPYPFERARYPIGRAERQPRALAHPRLHPLLDQEIVAPQIEGAVFQRRFEANADHDLRDHRVRGAAILPGAAQIEMLLAAAAHSAGQTPMGLANIAFTELLDIDASGLVQVVLSRNDRHQLAGQVMSRSTAGEWVRHAAGEFIFDRGQPEIVDLAGLRRRCPLDRDIDALYAHFAASGLVYGPAFRSVRHVWGGEREILAEISAAASAGYRLAPALLDGAFQALSLLFDAPGGDSFVPFAIDDIRLPDATPLPARVFCHGRRTDNGLGPVRSADMTLLDQTGRVLLRLRGLRLRQLADPQATVPSAEWLEIPCWRPSALPAPEPAQAQRTWLVFADSQGIAEALIDQIRAAGDAVVKVAAGAAFQEMADGFAVRPASVEDYTALATALAERRIDGLLHLWSCALPPGWPATAADIDQQLDLGAKSLLCVLRALGSQGGLPVRVGVATRYAQAIDGAQERPVAPIQAALWGLSHVVALEYPATRVVAVDLEAAPPEQNAARMWAEIQAAHPAGGSWAIYHGGQRLVAALAPAPVAVQPALRPHGVYLISGGQGGIGLEIARWIARQGAATVVLLNRSPLDSSAHPQRAQGIRDVAALGTVVETVTGDVADAPDITALVAAIVDRHGRLDGIFHAAGVLDDALLWNMDPARFDRVLRPKVHGTWALGQAAAQLDLAQFVICSSMASFEPSPGQANHAAANAVQDSLAHSLRRTGQPALSINWGLWGETGVVATEHYLALLRARGIYPFTIAEGLAGLEAALGSGAAQAAFAKKLPVSGLEARAAQLAAEHGLEALAGASAPLAQLCGAYVANALVVMGLHPLLHSSFTQASLAEQLRIAPQHRRVFARLLTLLQQLGKLQKTATGYELRDLTFQLDLDAAATALAAQYPGLASEIGLVRRCGSELGAVLTGDCDPLSLLFPKGSLEPSGQMYAQSPFARVYNTLAAEAIGGLQRTGQRLRILEVGAGTGGTTTPILARLDPAATDYTFSDISQRFLRDAQRKYAGHPGMRYAILDLEADLIAQGQHAASYDVIVAANVIHATSDIGQVVARLGQLLAPGGRMVIVELTQPQDWLDLTFGLTEGWWKFTDTAVRADYPLLDSPGWQAVLTRAGFAKVSSVAPALIDGSAPVVQAVITATGWRSVALQPEAHAASATPTLQPTSGANPAAHTAQRWLQDRLTARIIEALKLPGQTLPPASSFHDIGLDSLLAVEIAAVLRRDLGIDIGPTLFFEYPSVRELAAHLWQIQGDDLAALAAAASPPPPTVLTKPQNFIRAPAAVEARSQDIAIIGMACRFPGAADSDAFWELLCRGDDAVGDVPAARWDWREYFDPTPGATGKTYSRWGGYIEDVDCFDARFFNISPKEAALMDPQQRLFLQTAWHTLEHAGYAGAGSATTGVFVGCSYNHYLQLLNRHSPELAINHFAALGNNHALLANRVSYFLNLTGPSMSIDTLCSSALTALHMACSSLRNGEADMMLVGGVNLLLSADHYLSMSQMRAYAADGRCKAFDQRADGFVSGEGVGAVLIKPLAQAQADGDTIHAIIKGSAVTHNGRTSGLTIPQARNQAAAVRRAHAAAGWDPASVGYIEAHGTGTALGDPIEIEGLAAIFGPRQPAEPPCYLGSVKTNIGHLEAAAGIAGLIKTILSLKHGSIPASLHYETANPHIHFAATPFVVNTRVQPWPANQPRRAGINAFGLGGVNAHVALEQAPVETAAAETAASWMLPLSAASPAALNALIDRYYHYMLTAATQRLEDICYTAAVGRGSFRQRLAILATSASDLLDKLRLLRDSSTHQGLQQQGIFYGTDRPEHNDGLTAAFVFQGQDRTADLIAGAQAYTSGLPIDWESLYASSRVRRIAVPLYPFERQRHWFEDRVAQPALQLDQEEIEPALHPLLGIRLP